MLKIVSDTSCLYSRKAGLEKDLYITPLQVTINNTTYEELEDINSYDFIKLINQGFLPKSSQPPIGKIMELYESFDSEDDVLVISMTDGLSGTYANAVMATLDMPNPERFKVINSKTLCGPHQYLVDLALKLRDEGKTIEEIIFILNQKINNTISFLMPVDFDYLKRGGRLSKVAAGIGGLFNLKPVLLLREDGTKLDKFATTRSLKLAINKIITKMEEIKVDETYNIYIAHDGNGVMVRKIENYLRTSFANTEIKVIELTPAFITQGGPGCIAIQAIKK